MQITAALIKKGIPTQESYKTLVMLQEKPHHDHMYGLINEAQLKTIHASWEKIINSLYEFSNKFDNDPIILGNGQKIHTIEF